MRVAIIGSGIAGLTAGAYMSQAGNDVTIYEQFGEIGGVTAEITKDGYTWNQGQLLVEGFAPGEQVGEIWKELSLTDRLKISRGDRVYSFPDYRIEKPERYGGPKWRVDSLKKLFPEDADGLDRYYRDYVRFMELVTVGRRSERAIGIARLALKIRMYLKLLSFLPRLRWNARRMGDFYFSSKKLRASFLSILADFVVPPSEFQGLGIFMVNPEPAYDRRVPLEVSGAGRHPSYNYISGGCGVLVKRLAEKIEKAGGQFVTNSVVRRIIIEKGTAKGVILANGDRVEADLVIASGGANEFLNLFEEKTLSEEYKEYVAKIPLMESIFMVHLGVDYDPGVYQKSATTYYYNTYDVEGEINDIKQGKYHEGRGGFVVYICSKHSPEMAPAGHHAVTVYTIAPNRLDAGNWEERKEELADKLLMEAEVYVPGLREHTRVRLIATPEDFKKRTFSGHHSFGGVAPVMGKKGLPHKTPFERLWFIGAQSESGAGMNNVTEGVWRTVQMINRAIKKK